MADFLVKNISLWAIGGLAIIFFIWAIILQNKLKKVEKMLNNFCTGNSGKNLEELIISCSKGVNFVENKQEELFQESKKNHGIALGAIQKIGLTRYNPFQDIGGNQSFSAAFLNARKDGIVITSLYTREGTRVYAKSVIKGESEHTLSNEEQEAIKKAF